MGLIRKPKSKFHKWVHAFGGARKLSIAMDIDVSTIHHWCGRRARPTLELCVKILELSKGKLTASDLLESTSPK